LEDEEQHPTASGKNIPKIVASDKTCTDDFLTLLETRSDFFREIRNLTLLLTTFSKLTPESISLTFAIYVTCALFLATESENNFPGSLLQITFNKI